MIEKKFYPHLWLLLLYIPFVFIVKDFLPQNIARENGPIENFQLVLFAKANKIYYAKDCYYCYRVHASFTNLTQKIRRKYGLFMAWREHERVCEAYGYKNPLEYSRLRAQKAAISLLVINEATDYLSSEQKEDAEAYLQKDDKALNGLPLKHRMQWWAYKNMRHVCKVFGKISIFFDKLKQLKYKK